jgi:hypothetical protein
MKHFNLLTIKNFVLWLITPDDGKPFEKVIKMKTAEHIYLEGHTPPDKMPPMPELRFKEVTHRNLLMRRPIGRLSVYITSLVFILIVVCRVILL